MLHAASLTRPFLVHKPSVLLLLSVFSSHISGIKLHIALSAESACIISLCSASAQIQFAAISLSCLMGKCVYASVFINVLRLSYIIGLSNAVVLRVLLRVWPQISHCAYIWIDRGCQYIYTF